MASGLDVGLGLPLLFLGLGGSRRGKGGRHRLPGRAGVEEEGDHHEDEHEDDEEDGPGDSALGRLLRHGPDPTTAVDLRRASAQSRAGVLAWIERNRRWLIPWISALIVIGIEIGAGLFAQKPIPTEGHAVLGAFWLYAVGRGSQQAIEAGRHRQRLADYAGRRGISLEAAADEWDAFLAAVERQLPPGDRRGQ